MPRDSAVGVDRELKKALLGVNGTALAVALGAAADLAAHALAAGETSRLTTLLDQLHAELIEQRPDRVHLHRHPTRRLPNTRNIRLDGVIGRELLEAAPGVAASTGSACHAPLRIGQSIVAEAPVFPGQFVPKNALWAHTQFTVNFPGGLPLMAGATYTWRVRLDGDDSHVWATTFHVAGNPPPPVIG